MLRELKIAHANAIKTTIILLGKFSRKMALGYCGSCLKRILCEIFVKLGIFLN